MRRSWCYCAFWTSVCLAYAAPCFASASMFARWNEISEYFQSVDDSTSLNELAELVCTAKIFLLNEGFPVPQFSTLIEEISRYFESEQIELNQDQLDDLHFFLVNKEAELISSFCHLTLSNQEPRFELLKTNSNNQGKNKLLPLAADASGKVIIGFCKVLVGTVCLLVPHPAATVTGSGLILQGVSDIGEGLIEKSDENLKK